MGDNDDAQLALSSRLAERRREIESAILARVGQVSVEDGSRPAPLLPAAVSAGVEHGLAGVRHGADEAGPIPDALLAFANRSAHDGVGMETVLRSYFAGYALFCNFILQEAELGASLRPSGVRQILQGEARLFERVLAAVAGEYAQERRRLDRPPESRQLECVKGLLAGKPVDTADLAYDLDEWNVAAIAVGAGGPELLRDLARAADRRLLLVRPQADVTWAWLGGRRRVGAPALARHLGPHRSHALLALGEPARGEEGWRLTHQQAEAAMRVSRPGVKGVVLYSDVSLVASLSQDRVLTRSLHEIYLAPLADSRDGGDSLRRTLRAYFAASRNVSSAASALGVSRQTVGRRLQVVEAKLGRAIGDCAPEVEMALQLELIGHGHGPPPSP